MESAEARGVSPEPLPTLPPPVTPEPSEPVALQCAAHPRVETYLRCGRCDTPICPRCLIMTPVGARCRECARLRKLPIFEVRPIHYLRGLVAGLATAAIGGALLAFVPGLGFFGLLLLAGLGYAVGEATTAAANRKRGTGLALVAALAVPAGLTLGTAMLLVVGSGGTVELGTALAIGARSLLVPVWRVLLVLLAMGIAFSRVR